MTIQSFSSQSIKKKLGKVSETSDSQETFQQLFWGRALRSNGDPNSRDLGTAE